MSKEDTKKTEELEIGDEVIEAISEKVKASMPEIKIPTADEIAEKLAEKNEDIKTKDISEPTDGKVKDISMTSPMEKMSKERRFAKGLIASLRGDHATIKEYNDIAIKNWREKADYQNVTTAADGGSIVPDPEFVAEVDRLTDEYGVVARLANIRRTDRDSVTLLSGTNEISFTATNEATAVNAQKLTYASATAALKKYIATLVMTSELVEDAAVDIFQDAANEIARAQAKLWDTLVFTDSTYGLLSATNGDAYKTQTVGAALTNFDADDAMDAQYKVVSSARRNGRFFMHPTVWNEIRQTKEATTGGYLFGAPGQGVTPTIDGYPVELVDVLPDSGDITANEAFAVFGDLGRIMLHVGRVLETKAFDSGVVKDAGGTDINLITQDSWALRATTRVVPQTRFEGAFCIIGTGTVS